MVVEFVDFAEFVELAEFVGFAEFVDLNFRYSDTEQLIPPCIFAGAVNIGFQYFVDNIAVVESFGH